MRILSLFILSLLILFSFTFTFQTSQGSTSTIYLAGDSTVQNYDNDVYLGGWGQYLSYFLEQNIKVVNAAKGGRSSRSFINEGRLYDVEGNHNNFAENGGKSLDKTVQQGDFLFIQFGHNDDDTGLPGFYSTLVDRMVPLGESQGGKYPVKEGVKSPTNSLPSKFTELASSDEQKKALDTISSMGSEYYAYDSGGTFKWYLKQYIDFARKKKATPVLVTPVSRVTFNNGKITGKAGAFGEGFGYVEAVRQLAEEEDCLLIDLHKFTVEMLETAKEDNAGYLMALKPSDLRGDWPEGYDKAYGNEEAGCTGIEGTHYNKFGAYITAAYIAELISKQKSETHNSNKESFTFADYIVTDPKEKIKPSSKLPKSVVSSIHKLFKTIDPIVEQGGGDNPDDGGSHSGGGDGGDSNNPPFAPENDPKYNKNRKQEPYPEFTGNCGSWANIDNVCCAQYCDNMNSTQGCGDCGGPDSEHCKVIDSFACRSGDRGWDFHDIPNEFHYSRSTHFGLTFGGACGFGLYQVCGSNYKYEGEFATMCDAFCKAYPTLCKDPEGYTYRGNFAAPQGNYYTQFWGRLEGDRDNYLSCGECFEVHKTKADGTDLKPGDEGYQPPILLSVIDSCPCSANDKWCCGSQWDQCQEVYYLKYGCPVPEDSIHLDLSDIAMARLQTGDANGLSEAGIIPNKYRRVPCPSLGNMYIWLRDDSGPYWFAFSVVNSAGYGAIAVCEAKNDEGKWVKMLRDPNYSSSRPQERYGVWVTPQDTGPYNVPVAIRLTDGSGVTIIVDEAIKSFEQPADGIKGYYYIDIGTNFPEIPIPNPQ